MAVTEGDKLHLALPGDPGQAGAIAPAADTGTAAPGDQFANIRTVRPLPPL